MSWRLVRVVAAIAALPLLGSGCALRGPALRCPTRGGSAWSVLSSKRFVLYTDRGPDEARKTLVRMERTYDAFGSLSLKKYPKERIEVVHFERKRDLQAIRPHAAGFYLQRDVDERPTVAIHGFFGRQGQHIFQHELAHRFVRRNLPNAPVWLHEGLAQFYQTLRLEADAIVLGEPPRFRMRPTEVRTVAGLLQATRSSFYRGTARRRATNYVSAWAFVHMLVVGPRKYRLRFVRYLARLARGQRPSLAWKATFGGVPPGRLEKDFRAYLLRSRLPTLRGRPPGVTPPALGPVRRLSPAEVHLLWASLHAGNPRNAKKAVRQIEAARRHSPGSAEVRYWSGRVALRAGRRQQAVSDLEGAVRARPGEARYRLALLQARLSSGSGSKLHRKRLAGEVTHLLRRRLWPRARAALAHALGALGRTNQGLSIVRRALSEDPTCWQCAATMALLFYLKGSFGGAAALQRRALGMYPRHRPPRWLSRRLARYRRAALLAAKRRQRTAGRPGRPR